MPSEPIWLPAIYVTAFNRRIVGETDEPFRLREPGLLQSAVDSPRNHWLYAPEPLGRLAGRLMIALVRNHPFEQGNKRTALMSASAFLLENGFELRASDDVLADRILEMVSRQISDDEFLAYIARVVRRRDDG